ncbi:MAG TPA: heavy metal-binding domain-containing protein, partial [Hyphomonadaceae bacterium]|nr:heavy metal-binding domain-containing protein [Hyphomonadaceae bacterium]
MTSAKAKLRLLAAIAAIVALPANAQRAASEIALTERAAAPAAVVLGEVRAEIHQKSLFAKTPARDLADRELRAQAAKLGADAVVDIRYESSSPLLSKKGFTAVGKAVKFAPVQVAGAATAPPAAQPEESERVVVADALLPTRPQAPVPDPVINAPVIREPVPEPATPPPQQVATTAPAPAPVAPIPPPVAVAIASSPPPAIVHPAPVAAAVPAAPRVTPEALIVLTEEDLAGRAYERLGEVKATAR